MVVVIAVEETVLLVAVDGVVGGVDVEDEFLGRRGERCDELFDEDRSDAGQGFAVDAVLEPAEGGRRGEFGDAAGVGMVGGGLPERIVAEAVVIVEVFVSGGEAEEAVGQERALRVDDEQGMTRVGDGFVESVEQADLFVGFPQEQQAGIGGEVPGGELGDEFAALDAGKGDGLCGTLCHRGGCSEWVW